MKTPKEGKRDKIKYQIGQTLTFQCEDWIIRKKIVLGGEPWLVLYRSDGQFLESQLIPVSWLRKEPLAEELRKANENT